MRSPSRRTYMGIVTVCLLFCMALWLIGCAGPGEPGAPAKPTEPQTIMLRLERPADIAKANPRLLATTIRTTPYPIVIAPIPDGLSDAEFGRILRHEIRHTNGEDHDKRGVWLTGQGT